MTKKESGNKVQWRTTKLHNQKGTEANDLILKEDGEIIMQVQKQCHSTLLFFYCCRDVTTTERKRAMRSEADS